MIQQDNQYQDGGYGIAQNIKKILGVLLIFAGVLIAIWVFTNLYKIFTNPKEIEVFKQIFPSNPEIRTMEIEGKKVLLPVGIFNFLSYGICCLLLFVAGMISSGFITGGVNLLQANIQKVEMRIHNAIRDVKKTIEETKNQIKKKVTETNNDRVCRNQIKKPL